jgi:hypothetical protein
MLRENHDGSRSIYDPWTYTAIKGACAVHKCEGRANVKIYKNIFDHFYLIQYIFIFNLDNAHSIRMVVYSNGD